MSIESYNENQEQAQKLTEQEKEKMYLNCKLKVEEAWGHISTIWSKDMPETNKVAAIKNFKELFNEGATIMVGHNMMGIDDFCNKLKNREIDYQFLKQLDTKTRFREGQFIKETVPMQNNNQQIIWQRKIDFMSFKPHSNGNEKSELKGVDDIKPESVKQKERQKFQNAMQRTTAMYNEHEESEETDKKTANDILNSIA